VIPVTVFEIFLNALLFICVLRVSLCELFMNFSLGNILSFFSFTKYSHSVINSKHNFLLTCLIALQLYSSSECMNYL
jgi:hypothetical protein